MAFLKRPLFRLDNVTFFLNLSVIGTGGANDFDIDF